MAAGKENKTAPLGLRVTPSLKEALERAAADDHRTVAGYVEKVLSEHLERLEKLKLPRRGH